MNYGSPQFPFLYQVKSATDGRDETINEKFPNTHLYIICYSGARHGI